MKTNAEKQNETQSEKQNERQHETICRAQNRTHRMKHLTGPERNAELLGIPDNCTETIAISKPNGILLISRGAY